MTKIDKKATKLTRTVYPMPPDVKKKLEENGVLSDYYTRPGYQQNDYIGWINQAKQRVTRKKE